ncbi:MAG: transposase [Bacteroidales bacterium]|jgi:hypothetical protein|nr:transposase [Bacteroidales bacterium]
MLANSPKTANTSYKKKRVEQHHKCKAKHTKNIPGSDSKGAKFLSNHTHYSTTDPDARISTKPGKPRNMNYFGQLSVDTSNHVITGACADFADKRDSQCLEKLCEQTLDNLRENEIKMNELLADTGYSSESVCKNCEHRTRCCGEKTKFKRIERSEHHALYMQMHNKLAENERYAQRMRRLRRSTVEPVLGTLINFLGMKKVNTRGIAQAEKYVLMAVLCYNLKKLLKFKPKMLDSIATSMQKICLWKNFFYVFWGFQDLFLTRITP